MKKINDLNTNIICLVGMPGSGKSTLVDYLQSKGASTVYFGGIVVEEVKKYNNGQTNEAEERKTREKLREKYGMAAMAKLSIPKIDSLLENNKLVVIDGLYSWSEYKVIKTKYKSRVAVIAVAATRKNRHERLSNRTTRALNSEEANSRDFAEIEKLEKGGPIANADYTIVNDYDIGATIHTLESILEKINFAL